MRCQLVISRSVGSRIAPGRGSRAAPKTNQEAPKKIDQDIDRGIPDGARNQPLASRMAAPKNSPANDHAPMPKRPAAMVLGSAVCAPPNSKLRTRSIMLLAAHATAPAMTYRLGLNR